MSKGNPHPPINHRRARAESAWKDEGCPLHPACLECPRVMCVYDEMAEEHRLLDVVATGGQECKERAMFREGAC